MNSFKGTGGILKKTTESSQSEFKSEKKEETTYRSTSSLSSQRKDANSKILSIVKAVIISKLGVDAEEVVENASFVNDLGADSLDMVELIMEFEKTFNIEIADSEAERLRTVGDVVLYIAKHQG